MDDRIAGQIADLIAEGRSRYREYHAMCDLLEQLFFREHVVPIPDAYTATTRQVKAAIIEDVIRRVVAMLTEGYPSFTQIPIEEGPRAQARANKIEEWLNAALPRLEKQQGTTTFKNVTYNQALFGVGYLLAEYTPDAWDEADRAVLAGHRPGQDRQQHAKRIEVLRRRAPLPFHVQDLDPRSVYLFRDSRGITEALVGVRRQRLEVAQTYGRRVGVDQTTGGYRLLGDGLPPDAYVQSNTTWGTVDFWTHLDRQYVTYYADGMVLQRRPHGYHRPTVFECRGLGTSSRAPHHAHRSIVAPIVELIQGLDRILTLELQHATMMGFPMFKRTLAADAQPGIPDGFSNEERKEAAEAEGLGWRPGEEIVLAPGENVEAILPPPVASALKDISQLYLALIQQGGQLPPVARGDAPGPDAGYAINQLMQAYRSVFQPILGNSSVGYEELAEWMLWVIEERIGETVYVVGADPGDEDRKRQLWLGIGPGEIQGMYAVQCEIKAKHPIRDIGMQRAGVEAWGAGVLPVELVLEEYFGFPNAQKVLRMRKREDFLNTPEIKQLIVQEVLKRRALQEGQDVGAPAPTGLVGPNGQPIASPVNAGAANGPGLPAAASPTPPQPPGLPAPGGIPGVGITPNTFAQPGGVPVSV